MDFKHRLQRSFKPRFAVIYPFGVFVLLFSSLDDQSLRAGIGYIIAGLLIRLWSNGYAIKNDKLTISGPYAFVRDPLYLGTFLMAIGFTIVLKMGWVVGLLFLAALGLMYYKTIRSEQKMLLEKFGSVYQNYCAKVPAMIPWRLIPYTNGEQWPFNLQRLIKSKEHKPLFWITIILIAFHLKTRLLLEHKAMASKDWSLLFLAALLIGLDISYEMNKKLPFRDPQ
ncbi:MAG: isoprenylcysteine carboxylmethyltransferase family protein [Candidatus Omnitrophica bacterium]|nr:isoprenylcysteine carboxylmethyltransferase family protein [Candidatus Omnitrophota bacterium]